VRVRSTDPGGLSTEKAFTILVEDVNESPQAIELSATMVSENVPVGTVVGGLTTTDPDTPGGFTYTLVDGTGNADNGEFQIVDDQLLTAGALDYEAQSTYSVRIRTTDAGGLSWDQAFVIELIDQPELPGDLDADGDIDSSDFLSLLASWTGALDAGTGGRDFFSGDFDGDADVDSGDLLVFLGAWTGSQGHN
jgi:hypothetical protein